MATTFTGGKKIHTSQPQQNLVAPGKVMQNPFSSNITSSMYSMLNDLRANSFKSQISNLGKYAQPLRDLIFQVSPELKAVSEYYQERLNEPIPASTLGAYRENYRAAAAAQGFGGAIAGPEVSGAEAEYITALQEQTRASIAGQAAQFDTNLLGMMGFGNMPDNTQMGMQFAQQQQEFNFQQRQFEEQLKAANEQTDWGRREYQRLTSQLSGTGLYGTPPRSNTGYSDPYGNAKNMARQYIGFYDPQRVYGIQEAARQGLSGSSGWLYTPMGAGEGITYPEGWTSMMLERNYTAAKRRASSMYGYPKYNWTLGSW